MICRLPWVLPIVALIAGCSVLEVPVKDRRAAEAFVRHEQQPLAVRPVAIWYARGEPDRLLCGEIEAPAALRPRQSTLRYVYDVGTRPATGQVEFHKGWIASDDTGRALMDANRSIFNDLWAEHCAPFAPPSRRVAAFFG